MKLANQFINAEGKTESRSCETHGTYVSCHIIGKVWSCCPVCLEISKEAEVREREEKMRQEQIAAWERRIGQAGIPERFRDRSLQNYVAQTKEQQNALATCLNYAQHFEAISKRGGGIIMCGMPGTGKTHLAVSIGLHVMDHYRKIVLFTTAMRMMRAVKETYSRDSAKTESQVIDEFIYPDLLILDEVGVQFGSETEKNIFFDVLNGRYEKRKSTIFLSNKDLDGLKLFLGERVYDRLREDGTEYIPFTWDSYRGKA